MQRAFRRRFNIEPVPLPTPLVDLKNHITTAVNSVTQDILLRVWDELIYRLDVIRAAWGHIEKL
jgi:hypothetical protein